MKPQLWVPTLVFLLVSMPLVLLLNAMQWGGEYKVWIAIAAGVVATAYTQHKLKSKQEEQE